MSIATELIRIQNAKSAIQTAITNKGVTVPEGTKLDGMAGLIDSIEAGGGGMPEKYIAYETDAAGDITSASVVGFDRIWPYAFYYCSKLALTELPAGLTSIGNYAFYNCVQLALTELPAGLTRIGSNAFYNCAKLALTELPAGLTSIGINAFYYCQGLASLTFRGKPNSISSSAFQGCSNLLTINVPWAKGEVANAPWGATKATINYNYTG